VGVADEAGAGVRSYTAAATPKSGFKRPRKIGTTSISNRWRLLTRVRVPRPGHAA